MGRLEFVDWRQVVFKANYQGAFKKGPVDFPIITGNYFVIGLDPDLAWTWLPLARIGWRHYFGKALRPYLYVSRFPHFRKVFCKADSFFGRKGGII